MKSVGIIRKVDDLGRIVLPAELRRTLDIAEQDAMEIYETALPWCCGNMKRLAFLRLVSGHFVLPGKKCLSSLSSLPAVVGLIPTQRKFYQAFNI